MSEGITADQILTKVRQASFSLNNATIKTLAPGGVDLVPSAGANILLIPTLLVMQLDTTNGPYTNVGDLVLFSLGGVLSYISGPLMPYIQAKGALAGIPGGVNTFIFGMGPLSLAGTPETDDFGEAFTYGYRTAFGDAGGLPIKLRIDNYTPAWGEDLGSLTGGHESNTLKGVVEYRKFNLETRLFE